MKYTQEQKCQFVMRYQSGESVIDICTETGIARSTLYSWLKPYQTNVTDTGVQVTPHEFAVLKKRVTRLEDIIKVLKSAECTVSAPLQDKLRALEALHGKFSVHVLCDAMEVSRGTFYNHILRNKREKTSYQFRRAQLSEQIRQIYEESHQIFGSKKIKAILAERGVATSEKMVAKLMREMNLSSIRIGAKRNYYRFEREEMRDHLKAVFSVNAPNQVWVSDVTYFNYKGKTYYICMILDLYARKAIAYKISRKQSAQLITATFRSAYGNRRPEAGLIFHSDRGRQYTSFAMQKLLKKLQVKQSFSPTGKPTHNAVMESFFSSLKREELYRHSYHSENELKKCVEDYIGFYNNERPHAALGNKTPNAFENLYYEWQRTRKK